MPRVDNHSHIILADIRDMVAAARARKIDRYSITEHVSQFRGMRKSVAFGSMHGEGRLFEDLREYRSQFSRVDKPPAMTLRMGLEVDFSPRFEAKVGEFVNQEKWDVLLCSVHEMGDGSDVEASQIKPTDPVAEASKRWHEYLALQKMALESDFIPFGVLTHPTRMVRGTSRLPDDLDDLLLDLAKTAHRHGRALELNGKDLGYAPGLVRRVANACAKAGCSVSLGSDSHYPKDVYGNMKLATAMVDVFGLQQV